MRLIDKSIAKNQSLYFFEIIPHTGKHPYSFLELNITTVVVYLRSVCIWQFQLLDREKLMFVNDAICFVRINHFMYLFLIFLLTKRPTHMHIPN